MKTTIVTNVSLRRLHLLVELVKDLDERSGYVWGDSKSVWTTRSGWISPLTLRSADKKLILDWIAHRLAQLANEDSVDASLVIASCQLNTRLLTGVNVRESVDRILAHV